MPNVSLTLVPCDLSRFPLLSVRLVQPQRLTGKVKFYHRRKGYGFIIAPEADVATTNGIFVHRTAIYRRDLVFPSEGEIVTYEVTKDESGTFSHMSYFAPFYLIFFVIFPLLALLRHHFSLQPRIFFALLVILQTAPRPSTSSAPTPRPTCPSPVPTVPPALPALRARPVPLVLTATRRSASPAAAPVAPARPAAPRPPAPPVRPPPPPLSKRADEPTPRSDLRGKSPGLSRPPCPASRATAACAMHGGRCAPRRRA